MFIVPCRDQQQQSTAAEQSDTPGPGSGVRTTHKLVSLYSPLQSSLIFFTFFLVRTHDEDGRSSIAQDDSLVIDIIYPARPVSCHLVQ